MNIKYIKMDIKTHVSHLDNFIEFIWITLEVFFIIVIANIPPSRLIY